jgi:hypothetical protein
LARGRHLVLTKNGHSLLVSGISALTIHLKRRRFIHRLSARSQKPESWDADQAGRGH